MNKDTQHPLRRLGILDIMFMSYRELSHDELIEIITQLNWFVSMGLIETSNYFHWLPQDIK